MQHPLPSFGETMAGQDIASWLAQHHDTLVRAYIELAGDRDRFPGFAALPASAVRNVMERELLGLASLLATDPDGLTAATDTRSIELGRRLGGLSNDAG